VHVQFILIYSSISGSMLVGAVHIALSGTLVETRNPLCCVDKAGVSSSPVLTAVLTYLIANMTLLGDQRYNLKLLPAYPSEQQPCLSIKKK